MLREDRSGRSFRKQLEIWYTYNYLFLNKTVAVPFSAKPNTLTCPALQTHFYASLADLVPTAEGNESKFKRSVRLAGLDPHTSYLFSNITLLEPMRFGSEFIKLVDRLAGVFKAGSRNRSPSERLRVRLGSLIHAAGPRLAVTVEMGRNLLFWAFFFFLVCVITSCCQSVTLV